MNTMFKAVLIGSFLMSGVAFGADFSKNSNEELINMAGKVKADEVLEYNAEIRKRMENMIKKDAKAFREKIKAQKEKVYDNMTLKEFKAKKKEIREAIKKQCQDSKNADICPPKHKIEKGNKKEKPKNGQKCEMNKNKANKML